MARSDPNLSSEEATIDPDLPASARARIEGARAQAEVEFRSGYKKLKAGPEEAHLQDTENLLASYIHHVFFAFTEEALNSGWPAERVRGRAEAFLPHLIERTFFLKHPRARTVGRDSHRARFQDWAVFAVQNSDTWLEYQKALAELAGLDASKQQPLPGLPREALHRIAQAEKDARERYDRDKVPYFPMHPDFSFLEDSIFRSVARILEYVRIFAEEVLDGHLKEYLEVAPSDLLTNEALLQSVAGNVWTQTDELWKGYGYTLQFEPTSRRARYMTAMAAGTIDRHPELEPWRYPEGQQWADFISRMAEPESEMARLNTRYTATIRKVIGDRIRRFQHEAASRLKMRAGPETQCEKDRAGESVTNPSKPELAGDTAPMATEKESAQSSRAGGADTGNSNGGDRRASVDAYIEEVFSRTRKRITRTDIWKSARYKSRTEFERWERNDLEHPNKTAHQRFTRILTEKPHLK